MSNNKLQHEGRQIEVDLPDGFLTPQEADDLRQVAESAGSELESLLANLLRPEIVAGAHSAGVSDPFFDTFPGTENSQVLQASKLFKWDAEIKQFALHDANGNPVVDPDGTHNRPYVGPASYWQWAKSDPAFKDWFTSKSQPARGKGTQHSRYDETERAKQINELRHRI